MRILLIEEFDNAPVPQALRCENIAFDMVPPPEEDEPFVFPEGVYDAAILTTSDLSYGRSVKTCARLSLIREEGMQIPILIVLPHPSARDRARLLDAGADYVLAEPFVSDELAAVLRALARRSPAIKSEILTAGDLTFDRGRCTVKSRSGEIRLSGKETLLIDIFLSNPGQVVSRETIQGLGLGQSVHLQLYRGLPHTAAPQAPFHRLGGTDLRRARSGLLPRGISTKTHPERLLSGRSGCFSIFFVPVIPCGSVRAKRRIRCGSA